VAGCCQSVRAVAASSDAKSTRFVPRSWCTGRPRQAMTTRAESIAPYRGLDGCSGPNLVATGGNLHFYCFAEK
jgi:hypothetical protein